MSWATRLGDDYIPKPRRHKRVNSKRKGEKNVTLSVGIAARSQKRFAEIPTTYQEITPVSHPIRSRRKLTRAELLVESTEHIILLLLLLPHPVA